jgi:hypothetical protein
MMKEFEDQAQHAIVERRDLEAKEAGRRQKEGLNYPHH